MNVHFSYMDTAYARQAEVLARLRELGIRHLRDARPSPADAAGDRACREAARAGHASDA